MTRHRDLEADLHPSVITARHLRATADTWPDLLVALDPNNSTPLTGRITGSKGRPLPINVHVADVIAEIEGTVYFWVRTLAEETDWTPPDAGIDTTRAYRPAHIRPAPFQPGLFGKGAFAAYVRALTRPVYRLDTPTLLRALAQRTGHFTQHHDEGLAQAFVEECEDIRDKAEEAAHPRGWRKPIPTHRRCPADGCPGQLEAPLRPDSDYLPSLVCTADRKHTVEPYEWSRPKWRHRDEGKATA